MLVMIQWYAVLLILKCLTKLLQILWKWMYKLLVHRNISITSIIVHLGTVSLSKVLLFFFFSTAIHPVLWKNCIKSLIDTFQIYGCICLSGQTTSAHFIEIFILVDVSVSVWLGSFVRRQLIGPFTARPVQSLDLSPVLCNWSLVCVVVGRKL